MNSYESDFHDTFRRVRDFGVENESDYAADSLPAEILAEIGAGVTEIESLASAQDSNISSTRQGTEAKSLAHEDLVDQMEAIAQTGEGLALTIPGLANKFRAPGGLSDGDLLTLARSFVTDATPLAAEFIRHGMSKDFLSDLTEARTAFEHTITERDLKRESHVSATAAIGPVIARLAKKLRQLDIVMRNIYRDDRAKLAAWTSASHKARRSRKGKPPVPPTPPKPPSAGNEDENK